MKTLTNSMRLPMLPLQTMLLVLILRVHNTSTAHPLNHLEPRLVLLVRLDLLDVHAVERLNC